MGLHPDDGQARRSVVLTTLGRSAGPLTLELLGKASVNPSAICGVLSGGWLGSVLSSRESPGAPGRYCGTPLSAPGKMFPGSKGFAGTTQLAKPLR